MMRRRVAMSLLAVAALAPAATPATAGAATPPDARLSPTVRWPDRQITLGLPVKRVLDARDVTVRENGVPVRGVRVTSEADNRRRGVIIAIDTSLTMRGEPIRQAMAAARSFARRRAARMPLGVVFFSKTPRLALAPTTDTRRIDATLAVGPELSRGTRIFDAASAGVQALRAKRLTSGVVVVLSDGAEAIRGSAISPSRLTTQARGADVRIFSVGLASRSFDSAALRVMSRGTGGRYGEAARPQDLPPLFAAIGERLSSEYLVAYRSTRPSGGRVDVRVAVEGEPGAATLAYQAPKVSFDGAGPGHAADSAGLEPARVVAVAAIAFVLLTFVLYVALRPRRRSVVSRIGDFAAVPAAAAPPTMTDVRANDQRDRREPSAVWRRYADAVELSGLGVSPQVLALSTAIATTVVAWYAGGVLGRPPLAVLALSVPLAVRAVVMSRLNARRRAFEEQLPDNLQVMASALRAGFSFSAAMAAMADDAPEPSRSELRRAAADEQLGVDVADCLRAVGDRMQSAEIEYVGIVARMQRDAGGNTAEVLEHVVETIRDRLQLRRMVRTLTAQGRLGGAVISGVPVVMAFLMAAMDPGYFDPMLGSPVGVAMFFAAVVLLGVGWFAIRKIVDVEP